MIITTLKLKKKKTETEIWKAKLKFYFQKLYVTFGNFFKIMIFIALHLLLVFIFYIERICKEKKENFC